MASEQKDKLIVEALGECWHEWSGPASDSCICEKCGVKFFDIDLDDPSYCSLAIPDGFFWIWERAQKMEWWNIFFEHIFWKTFELDDPYTWFVDFVNPPRFRDTLSNWLEANPEKWRKGC